MEVSFGNRTEVTKIKLINTGTVDVTSLMLSYSDDGESWVTGDTVILKGWKPALTKFAKIDVNLL